MQISRIVYAYLIKFKQKLFQHAFTKKQVLTAIPSKKHCNSVKMSIKYFKDYSWSSHVSMKNLYCYGFFFLL